MLDEIKGIVYGTAIGDAIGVPSEFMSREQLKNEPITDMIGNYGAHNQPKGTWSDDTSLMLALIDAMTLGNDKEEFNLRMNCNLSSFSEYGLFTINGLFDIGNTTSRVCDKIANKPLTKLKTETFGEPFSSSNGNGGLMRIMPCVLLENKTYVELAETIAYVNSFTHKHILNHYCCTFLIIFAKELKKNGNNFNRAFQHTCRIILDLIYENSNEKLLVDFPVFEEFLKLDTISKEDKPNLYGSTGFVFTTLTSVLMIYKNAKTYKDAVLEAANIGGDTDTIGAIVGGLYGYVNGYSSIPFDYVRFILGKDQLDKAVDQLEKIKNNYDLTI